MSPPAPALALLACLLLTSAAGLVACGGASGAGSDGDAGAAGEGVDGDGLGDGGARGDVGAPGDGGGKSAGDGSTTTTPGAKRVFVTSASFTGDLRAAGGGTSGPDGADRLCARAATEAGLGAGPWVAWISMAGRDAIGRVTAPGPWVTVGGTRAFDDKAALTAGTGLRAPVTTERGAATNGPVWTGTDPNGTASGFDCTYFTESIPQTRGTIGDPTAIGSASWTTVPASAVRCDTTAALYCFEQ